MTETATETPFERVTISLPPDLILKLDDAAKADRRTRSNFILTSLEEIFRETTNTSEQ